MQKNRIFVVDDNDDLRFCYVELLNRAGYDVREASNGASAFAMLEQESRPEVIVLDLEMPEMNGFKFLSKLRKDRRFATIPIILSTGHLFASEIAEVLDVQLFPKPSESTQLLKMVESAINASHPVL